MNSISIMLLLASLCSSNTPCQFRPLDDAHVMIERSSRSINYYCLSWRKTTAGVLFKFREIIFKPGTNRDPGNTATFAAIEFCRKVEK